MIIFVGYRVKGRNGIVFRKWANSILKQYLIRGYAIDQRRLDHYDDLKDVVRLMSRALTLQDKVSEREYSGLFSVITDYVYDWAVVRHKFCPSGARCLPMLGKQRSHLGQASCPFSEDLLCLPMADFFIFSKLAKWEICRIKRMKISLCHVFCILLPNDRQGRENK